MLESAIIEFLSALQGDYDPEPGDAVYLPPEQTLAFLSFVATFTRWRPPSATSLN